MYWVVSAWRAKRNATQTGEPHAYRILRLAVLATTFVLLLSTWLRIGLLGRRFVPANATVQYIGVALTACGIALMTWGRHHLGQYWSDKVELKVDHQLIRSGPYAYIRHPIYSGVLLGVAGTAMVVGESRGVLAFGILVVNYIVKAKREERILAEKFGQAFTSIGSKPAS